MATRRQRADIPVHRALGVEIGRPDQEQAALLVFAGDGVEQLLVGMMGDQWASGEVSAMASSNTAAM